MKRNLLLAACRDPWFLHRRTRWLHNTSRLAPSHPPRTCRCQLQGQVTVVSRGPLTPAWVFLHSKVFFKLSRGLVWGVSLSPSLQCQTNRVAPDLQTCKQRKLLCLASFSHCYNFYSVLLALLPSFFPSHTPQTMSLPASNATEISLHPWESGPIRLGHPPPLRSA